MRSISRTGCWEKQKSIPLMLNSVASPPLALPPLTIGQHSLALFQCCALPCMDPSHPYCWLVCEPWPWRNSSTGQGPLPTKLPTAMKSLPGRALWWSVCCFVSDDLISIVCAVCFSGSDLCGNLGGLASKSGLSYIWANLEVKSKYCLNARSSFPEGSLLHVMCQASMLIGIVLARYLNFTSIIALHLWFCKDVPIETSESLTCSYLFVSYLC